MTTQALQTLFLRDLNRLKKEINAYSAEANIWKLDRDIANTAGNLCLHLAGNIQHFIGATLGETGYVRNRENEFGLKNVPRAILIEEVDNTISMLQEVLPKITVEKLAEDYPREVLGKILRVEPFLIHLYGHLNYHLGQINYHRRLLD
ncbi:MAG: DUF1572 domain-containing protein [Bacteroidetes bacterium]|nr:DUF1572 domain-containing protein [Bacteroidota bacterium]